MLHEHDDDDDDDDGRFQFTHILELSILGTPDFRNCKSLPLQAGFVYTQVYFKTGFPLFFRVL